MIQKIILVGNLGRPFELKTSKSGTTWAEASMAVNTKKRGEQVTTWYKLKAFGKAAETLSKYTDKGQQLYVEGVPQAEAWLPNGTVTPMCQIAVMVDTFQFIGGGKQEHTAKDTQAIAANDAQGNEDLEWL